MRTLSKGNLLTKLKFYKKKELTERTFVIVSVYKNSGKFPKNFLLTPKIVPLANLSKNFEIAHG